MCKMPFIHCAYKMQATPVSDIAVTATRRGGKVQPLTERACTRTSASSICDCSVRRSRR